MGKYLPVEFIVDLGAKKMSMNNIPTKDQIKLVLKVLLKLHDHLVKTSSESLGSVHLILLVMLLCMLKFAAHLSFSLDKVFLW